MSNSQVFLLVLDFKFLNVCFRVFCLNRLRVPCTHQCLVYHCLFIYQRKQVIDHQAIPYLDFKNGSFQCFHLTSKTLESGQEQHKGRLIKKPSRRQERQCLVKAPSFPTLGFAQDLLWGFTLKITPALVVELWVSYPQIYFETFTGLFS